MANRIFEVMAQADASNFVATDFLLFQSAGASAKSVQVSQSGDQFGGTLLTYDGKTLNFPGANLAEASQADRIVFNDESLLLFGTASNDSTLAGHVGMKDSAVYGFAGDDSITTGSGNDYAYGGNGADTIVGGDGADHLYGQSPSGGADGADSITGGAGNDYIQGNAANDTLFGGDGRDRILGGAGDDSINGGSGHDTVNGNIGNDSIDGGLDNDVLRGGQGNDTVLGGDGNDILQGDLGDDFLAGGTGYDVLFGGAGDDVFDFSEDSQYLASGSFAGIVDVIADFENGADKIELGFSTAASVIVGSSAASFQVTTAGFLAAADYANGLLEGRVDTVAAVLIGNDAYLFYKQGGGTFDVSDTVDAAIKILGVSAEAIDATDFVAP